MFLSIFGTGIYNSAKLKQLTVFVIEPLGKFAIEVIPQQAFRDWLGKVQSHFVEPLYTDKESIYNNSLYMVPAEFAGHLDFFLKDHFDMIFVNELGAWIIQDSLWPANRTLEMFKKWFAVKTFEFCWDLDEEKDDMLLWNPN